MLEELNPSRGRPAYVVASNPYAINKSPCRVAQDDCCAPGPSPEPEPPLTPPCITVVFSGNPADPAPIDFAWNETTGRYEAFGGSTMTYDASLGWIISTPNSSYRPITVSNNPVNTYQNTSGQTMSVVPCDNVVTPLPSCIETLFSGAGSTTGQWTLNLANEYVPATPTQGSLVFIPNIGWRWVDGNGVIFSGPTTENDPRGSYTSTDGDYALIGTCQEVPPPPPPPGCVQTTYSTTGGAMGRFNLNLALEYVPDNPAQGTLVYTGGRWTLTIDGVSHAGPEDPSDPIGSYESVEGGFVLITPCGDAPPPPPGCINTVFSQIPAFAGGTHTLTTPTLYTPGAPSRGTVSFVNGRWQIVSQDGTQTLLGPTNPSDPRGSYSNGSQYLLIANC